MKKLKKYNDFLNEQDNWATELPKNVGLFQYNDAIDYTLLDNSASDDAIIELCNKAKEYGTKSVCVMPKHVALATNELKDSKVLVCSVISFPEGTNSIQEKENETHQVIGDGADEVDMVINYELLKEYWDNEDDYIEIQKELIEEVENLVYICHSSNNKNGDDIILKVIVESGLLNDEQTEEVTHICLKAEADFIKTSTGMVSVGAELGKIKIMSNAIKNAKSNMKIKASGGVRTIGDIESYAPFVDRYGMGYGSVDKLNNVDSDTEGY